MKWLLIVLITFWLSACTLLPTSSTDNSDQPTTDQILKDEKLHAMFDNFSQVDSYQVTITPTNQAEVKSLVLQFQQPDSLRTITTTDQGTTEMIYLNGATYMKMPGNQAWMKMSVPKTDLALEIGQIDINSWRNQATTSPAAFTYIGEIDCGNYTCYSYEFIDGQGNTISISFDTDEYLLRAVKTTSNLGDITTLEYDYSPIVIEAPTNAVEFSIPDNPTADDISKLQSIYGDQE